ncbi:DUF3208 domain-containing protein [Thermus thermamylovorans]|uniref:DUF3208 domain-containing protein n=1 Tax=Thermus thermamylovorans TaxID=2509362 RepID=A0A4V2IV78_9DEIN|nr:DUF3208 domain-containing protein [Thermus thermamylovorans]TBH21235.1 DUF3208 domain-containing protein [Thermus thermamylovorans]
MQAVRLFQGYLWHPEELPLDPKALLPGEVGGARLLLDRVPPPTSFFEDGTPTAGQRFYQLTLLLLTEESPEALKPVAEAVAPVLQGLLEALPPGVGWLLLEDLRPL